LKSSNCGFVAAMWAKSCNLELSGRNLKEQKVSYLFYWNLISAGGFVMRSRNACQYWRSTEKSNAGI